MIFRVTVEGVEENFVSFKGNYFGPRSPGILVGGWIFADLHNVDTTLECPVELKKPVDQPFRSLLLKGAVKINGERVSIH